MTIVKRWALIGNGLIWCYYAANDGKQDLVWFWSYPAAVEFISN
jgi:hypothetical protein